MDGTTFMTDAHAFPVEMQPVFDQFGEEIPGSQCVMRTDNNTVLGVHGSRYSIVPHDDVVNSIMDAASGIGGDPKLDIKVIEGGRKLRGEILFDDLVVEPKVGDYVKFRVSFFNSYDGSWSFSQSADGLRLWCLNGCTTPAHTARSRFKHTVNINVEAAASKIRLGLETFMESPQLWREWTGVHVTLEEAEHFFKKTLAKAASNTSKLKHNEKQLQELCGFYKNEVGQLGANKWALYNACTYWASHTSHLRNPEVARRNREMQLASAMEHNAWTEMFDDCIPY
jgi:hypothetical protein